jgi:hypothetical protein
MFGVEEFLTLFQETTVKYLDDNRFFAYFPITSKQERIESNMDSAIALVVIYDTRTGYINASRLVKAVSSMDQPKAFSDLRRNKAYRDVLTDIELALNARMLEDRYRALPCWKCSDAHYTAEYKVERSFAGNEAHGYYIHPDCLIHVLVWANKMLASRINNIVLLSLMRQGQNETVTLKTEASELLDSLYDDIDKKKEAIAELTSENKDLVLQQRIDKFEINKLNSYLTDLQSSVDFIKLTRKYTRKLSKPSLYQAVMVVRYYDETGPFSRGSDFSKVTIAVINGDDVEKFVEEHSNLLRDVTKRIRVRMDRHRKDEGGSECDDAAYTFVPQSEIVLKINKLQHVPIDMVEDFELKYNDKFAIHIEKDEIGIPILYIEDDFKLFEKYIGEYLVDHMIF